MNAPNTASTPVSAGCPAVARYLVAHERRGLKTNENSKIPWEDNS